MNGRTDWKKIVCRSNYLDNKSIEAMAECSEVIDLVFQNFQVDLPNEALLKLAGFGKLRRIHFNLGHNNPARTRGLLKSLALTNPALESVVFLGGPYSHDDVVALAKCPSLSHLITDSDDSVNGATINELSKGCQELKSLHLYQRKDSGWIDAEGVVALANWPELNDLVLTLPKKAGDDEIEILAKNAPNLTEVTLYGIENITDHGVENLLKGIKALTSISLPDAKNITDTSLAVLAKQKSLVKIDFNAASGITKNGLRVFVGMGDLRFLDLSSTREIDDDGLKWMADHLTSLSDLSLGGSTKITDEGLRSVARCPSLRMLHIKGALPNVTSASLESLANCREIRYVNIEGRSRIDTAGIITLN